MKTFLITFSSILIAFTSFSQELKATEFKALVNVLVSDLTDHPIKNESIMFVSRDDLREFITTTDEIGKAQILLPKGKTYDVKYKDLIEKVKHSSFEIPSGLGKYSFDIQIKFEPSDMVDLKGVLFSEDGKIDEMSAIELDMMVEVLVLNPKMEIVIAAHSDNTENEKISISKTQKQADTIKDYIISKGIGSERIKAIGMGSSQPLSPNALPEGREQNNRIEIRVTKKYLN